MTVEGVNIRSKHMKPMKEGETGRIMKREARHAHLGLWWAAQRAHLTRRGRPARRFRSAARGPALVRLRAGPAAVTLEAALETVRSGGQAGHTAK